MRAPIVGLTTYGRYDPIVRCGFYNEWFAVPAAYVEAIRRAGGLPVLLPAVPTDWLAVLEPLDAVVVSGGGDIDPSRYGGDANHPALSRVDRERDEGELALVKELTGRTRLPTLCICRGLQVLNIALGGTLHEHVPDVVGHDDRRDPEGRKLVARRLQVRPESRLARIAGSSDITVRTGNHQSINKLGAGLHPSVVAPDGIVEAAEMPGHPWLIGVQWHPEASAAEDPIQQGLFDDLVRTAGAS